MKIVGCYLLSVGLAVDRVDKWLFLAGKRARRTVCKTRVVGALKLCISALLCTAQTGGQTYPGLPTAKRTSYTQVIHIKYYPT